MDDLDEEFEDMKNQCSGDQHKWDFPVIMGDWCYCGQKRWGDV